MNRSIILYLSFAYCLLAASCSHDKDYVLDVDYNTTALVIADNDNLSVFNAGMRPIGLIQKLQAPGPFTVLVPSDAAFQKIGMDSKSIQLLSTQNLSNLMLYHIIDGTYRLDNLPFLFNQEIKSQRGKLYVTHWIKERDTILTINGARILNQRMTTSNGLIHVIDRVLEPFKHERLSDAIGDDNSLTFFKEALRSSGLEPLLNNAGEYTVFAPNNTAMKANGFTSLQQIHDTDPEVLKSFIRYHIADTRRFVYDYILTTDKTHISQQRMLDGYNCRINLLPDYLAPGSFLGITLQGPGNLSPVTVVKQDVLTGNGILHTIDGVLKPTR